ncbi:MAG TPA: DUF2203 domain-containing protein [Candidatus Binataceae bacterium]|nr:DUF2203 domain-containing protein [Candidatus Binataceae bacterium]
MATNQFAKLFTEQEANELIPRLEALVRKLQANAAQARARAAQAGPSADLEALSRSDPPMRAAMREMGKVAEEIQGLGCFLKDVDLGLVDFPGEVNGDTVFLCWQYGEPHLVAWHPIDEGFGSRRPLPGGPKVYLN